MGKKIQPSKKKIKNKRKITEAYIQDLEQRSGIQFEGDIRREEDIEAFKDMAKCIIADKRAYAIKKRKQYEEKYGISQSQSKPIENNEEFSYEEEQQ